MAQRSSASRFCAECRSHIRRGRQQPRYTKRMPAIVAPSATGGASVVGAGVARRLPPPRHPIRRHLCPVPSLSFFSRSRTIVLLPFPQPHRPTVFPAVVPAHPPTATLHPPFSLAIPLALSWQPPPAAVSIGPVVPRQSTAVAPTSEHGPPPPSSPS